MRKIASLLVVGLLLMTSLMSFAGGSDENFVHTLPEEFVELPMELPVEVPSGGVTPRSDCNHSYGEDRSPKITEQYNCFRYRTYYEITCSECGAFLRTEDVRYYTNNEHIGEFEYGEIYKEAGVWYKDVYCAGCGEYLTRNQVNP